MRKTLVATLAITLAITGAYAKASQPDLNPESIKSVMARVADWQLANPSKHPTTDWTHGALFAGLTAHAQMTQNQKYQKALINFGQKNNWLPHKRKNNVFHADDHAVAQMYLEMYKKYKDPKMITPIKQLFDYILENQPDTPLTHDNWAHKKRYNWCDALFMGPPVWAKLARITGQEKYLDYINKEWWATTDYLFDKEENLYFRDDRYFDKREANGEKVFWSRGNGWVFGGLVRVLEEMPENYPDRPKYVDLYKKMADKIVKIQPEEGMWHSSLLDPVTFGTKEASGSGFYCYGLAWGINHGLLDSETYLPAVKKAWTELVSCVHSDGKLGNVQPIGADPRKVRADQTEIYGVGAFLLAGSEVYKIAMLNGKPKKKFIITNPAQIFRDNQTISLDLKDIHKRVKGLTKNNVAIFEFKTNRFLLKQIVQENGSTEVLFQTNFAPGEKKYYYITEEPQKAVNAEIQNTSVSNFIPERKDDFAWENDKAGFRMYGPALEDETITCGIDAFGKSVSYPVLEKMLTTKGFNYHADHGEGGDFYKVGNTLGCGGAAPFIDGKVCLPSNNFSKWKIIANGPIRTIFELTYKPWKAGSVTVSETKRISLDKGSNLNKIECYYHSKKGKNIPVAAGIVLQKTNKKTIDADNIIAYWTSAGKNGNIGCGVVYPDATKANALEADGHLLLKTVHNTSNPFVYYAGSCWDKNEQFDTFDKWQNYLERFKKQIDNPVVVKFENSSTKQISVEQVRRVLEKKASSHPRLFVSDKQLDDVKKRIKESDVLQTLHQEVITRADSLIDKETLTRKKIGRRLLSVSREAVNRLMNLSWAYRTTGEEKYLKRAEKEMLAIADFKDWNPSHFLDVAEMTMGLAVGYDWLYDDLSDNSRKIIRSAILEKGIKKSLDGKRYNWWIDSDINWNQVCHAGITCGALAIMEDEPELAEKVIHRSANKVQIAMDAYGPDGAYPEGPGYWVYGTTYNVILIEALDSALGTDFGLSERTGFAKSAEYYLHATGPTGLYFNYADSGSKGGLIPTVSWFAKRYENPSILWTQNLILGDIIRRDPSKLAQYRTSVMALLWAAPDAKKPESLSWMGRGQNPVAMFRSSWDKDATYLAIKGGSPNVSHGHMDVGSFVIDADGVRWAMDLGKESYHRIESMGISLWSRSQNADRWKLFRYGNFGHNTLAVNNNLQRADGFAPIDQFSNCKEFPHAVINLSKLYEGQLKKAIRGASLLPSGQVLIQDELEAANEPAVVRWNMITPAEVEIKSNNSAVLKQAGKKLQFEVVTDKDVKVATYSTEPRSKYDAENPNTRMIGFDIKLKAGEKATVKVVMTPGAKSKPVKGNPGMVKTWSQTVQSKCSM